MDILLLNPPATKAGEPPLGLAVLLGFLRSRGLQTDAIDANLDACLYLLDEERLRRAAGPTPSTALRRALNHTARSLRFLRTPAACRSFSRYQTAVHHLNHALGAYTPPEGEERLTLGDYTHDGLSEFVPTDLERVLRGEAVTLFDDYFRQQLLPQVLQRAPKMVGISVNYRHQVIPAFALAGLLRRHCPGLTLVGGGGMLSSWRSALKEQSLRFSTFSHLVFGPGEASLEALAKGIGPTDYFLEDPAVVAFEPDFSFASPTAYLSPKPILPVSASRGCYWRRCLFCPEAASPTHPYAGSEPGAFVDLLTTLAARYGVRHFHLTDNAVPIPVLREMVIRREELAGIGWHGFIRFEQDLLDPGFVSGLAASGCRVLQLGLESGSQRVLDRLRKGTRLEEVARMLDNLRRAGIATYVYIMLGTPGETREDAELTLRFLERHAGAINYLNLAIMNLPRESRLLDDPSATGIDASAPLSEEAPLGLYRSFVPASGWGRGEARRFLQQRLLGSPVIREIVNRVPPYFTSNHAFLFSR
ncbi:MAG: radical SAM protein [Desulfuromonadaceae bacterium GWC2_58_13]|nr:MAG: radical SAM protein [Desulfuromonadaceae bacterium GWC2_58_13]